MQNVAEELYFANLKLFTPLLVFYPLFLHLKSKKREPFETLPKLSMSQRKKKSIFMFRASNRDSDNTILFRSIELLMKTADRSLIRPKLLFEIFFEKKLLLKIRHFLAFSSPLLTTVQRLFLEKLKCFPFSSMKFFKGVAWPFWS